MPFGVAAVLITAAQMDNTECSICVVYSYEASRVAFCKSIVKFFGRSRYHLQDAPRPLICSEKGYSMYRLKLEAV